MLSVEDWAEIRRKIAEELIGQQFIKGEVALENVRDQPLRHVLHNGRFKVEDIRFADRRSECVDHVSKQRVKLVARKGSFPISGLQWPQRLRAWRSASSFFTPLLRTCPVGTARFSSRVDVEAARAAILATRVVFSGATFSTALAFARSIAAPPCKHLTFLDFTVPIGGRRPRDVCYRYGNIGPVSDASNFPQRLTALLAERNMTQLELAARIGVTRAAMSRYVSGEREPRLVTLVRIAEELDVNVDELISPESNSVGTALRIVARTKLTEEQKSQFREALDRGGRP